MRKRWGESDREEEEGEGTGGERGRERQGRERMGMSRVLIYHSPTYFLEAVSLTESGARLLANKPKILSPFP